MFDAWTDDQFTAWLAGFFDGEGCIHIPKSGVGIDCSIASTTRDVIEAVHARLSLGTTEQVAFDRENWKTKYVWRVRRYSEAEIIISRMRPFLTIKAAKADEALEYLALKQEPIRARHHLYLEIGALIDSGVPRREVAERYGIQRKTIDWIYRYQPVLLDRARTGSKPGEPTEYVQRHQKVKVTVATSTVRPHGRWHLMNEVTVREVRTRLADGETPVALAVEFGVNRQTIHDIGNRKTWKSVA